MIRELLIDLIGKRTDNYTWRRDKDCFRLDEYRSVCILHLDGKLGDAIVMSPLIEGLKTAYPHLNISIASSESFVTFWESNPWIDSVIPIPSRATSTFRKIIDLDKIGRAHQSTFDLLISLEPFSTLDNFVLVSRLNSKTNVGFMKEAYRLFDYSLLDFTFTTSRSHITKRIESIFQVLGVPGSPVDYAQFVPISQDSIERVRKIIGNKVPDQQFIYFNTYGGGKDRVFSPESARQVIKSLTQHNFNKVFVGVPNENSAAYHAVISEFGSKVVTGLSPFASLLDMVAFVSLMDGIISPDSGVVHVSGALNLNTVVLFRDHAYNPIVWKPVGRNSKSLLSNSGKDINDFDWAAVSCAIEQTFKPK